MINLKGNENLKKTTVQEHYQKPRITGVSKAVNQECDGAKPYTNTNMKTVKIRIPIKSILLIVWPRYSLGTVMS
ncbi:hypothetical protein C5745_16515 [Sphingobacterium haloxyli]|uniref:Uncharacterized protein n=1 Tax=Sphingobacterium haloxyli TaxID=2100533 RepID=A0A2S9J0A1_9SPHI|nr:hypothetical protein C5745_16515 [Sphingobacterium haloxyli]